jgi:hypothetical protein
MAESRVRLLNHLTIHGFPRWFADKSRLTDAELAEFHRKEHEKAAHEQEARLNA